MINFLELEDENLEISSDDGLGSLVGAMPSFTNFSSDHLPMLSQSLSDCDDFTQWQLSRFNRTGQAKIINTLDVSFRLYKKNFKLCFLLFIPYICCAIISRKIHAIYMMVPINAVSSLVSSSITFSIISMEPATSRLKCIFTSRGMFAFAYLLLAHFFTINFVSNFVNRNSKIFMNIALTLIVNYIGFYITPFVFEGKTLSISCIIKYSLQLITQIIPIIQSSAIFFVYISLTWIGPFTLGFTSWLAMFMKSQTFLAVCGSSSS